MLLAHRIPHAPPPLAPGEGHLLLLDPDSAAHPAIRLLCCCEELDDSGGYGTNGQSRRRDARGGAARGGQRCRSGGAATALRAPSTHPHTSAPRSTGRSAYGRARVAPAYGLDESPRVRRGGRAGEKRDRGRNILWTPMRRSGMSFA